MSVSKIQISRDGGSKAIGNDSGVPNFIKTLNYKFVVVETDLVSGRQCCPVEAWRRDSLKS